MFFQTVAGPEISGVTSLTLLERMKVREPEGWVRFCRVYGPLVYGWARHAGLQCDDASDTVQEVFLVVAARITEFCRLQDRNFRNWLWTITHHLLQAHYRKLGSRPVAVGGTSGHFQISQLMEDPAEDERAEDLAEELDDHRSIVIRVLQQLQNEVQDVSWQAFWRTAVGGEPAGDVAQELGLTRWAVYKIKGRMLLRVRQELDGLVPWRDLLKIDDRDESLRSTT